MQLSNDCCLIVFEYEPHAFWLVGDFKYLRKLIKCLAHRKVQSYLTEKGITLGKLLPLDNLMYIRRLITSSPEPRSLFFYYLLMFLDEGQEINLSNLFNVCIGEASDKDVEALEMAMAIGICPQHLKFCFSEWALEYNESAFCQRFKCKMLKCKPSLAVWIILQTLLWKIKGRFEILDTLIRQEMYKLRSGPLIECDILLASKIQTQIWELQMVSCCRKEKQFIAWVKRVLVC